MYLLTAMARCQDGPSYVSLDEFELSQPFFQLFNCLSMIALTLAFFESFISPQFFFVFFVLPQCILYSCSARTLATRLAKFVNHLIVGSPKLENTH